MLEYIVALMCLSMHRPEPSLEPYMASPRDPKPNLNDEQELVTELLLTDPRTVLLNLGRLEPAPKPEYDDQTPAPKGFWSFDKPLRPPMGFADTGLWPFPPSPKHVRALKCAPRKPKPELKF